MIQIRAKAPFLKHLHLYKENGIDYDHNISEYLINYLKPTSFWSIPSISGQYGQLVLSV